MAPRHLFLDLDGTLTDPRDGITGSIRHALSRLREPVPAAQDLTHFIGPSLGRVFQVLLRTQDEAIIQQAVAAYREHFTSTGILETRPYQGIPEALASLQRLGYTLCVVTSKPRDYAVQIVDHLGLGEHFTSIYGSTLSDLNSNKATLIRQALETEVASPGTVTVVGDRGEDVLGAKGHGLRAVGVTWGFGTPAELSGADRIVHSPPELVAWANENRSA
jgi:phosphoglycolate phosphatase